MKGRRLSKFDLPPCCLLHTHNARSLPGVDNLPAMHYTGCPLKSGTLDFVTLIFENIIVFSYIISSDKTLSSERNDTKIIEIG